MTIHDRDKIIAAAIGCIEGPYDRSRAITITGNEIERLYAIAFESGRQAEREACAAACMPHDDDDAMDRQAKAECGRAIRARGDMK